MNTDAEDGRPEQLWGVSCYFNPGRYERRRMNHRLFRARLGIPLLTVELSRDGTWDLALDDADTVLRVEGGDVLWQKERLLNVGVAALPAGCNKVAWLDGDVLFERSDWAAEAVRLLEERPLVQLFSHFVDLPRDATCAPAEDLPQGRSYAHLHDLGGHEAELFDAMWGSFRSPTSDGTQVVRKRSSGFGWAARRELLERHGLYDACILGSGDRAIACAAYGRGATSSLNFIRNERQREHYLAWAEPFGQAVGGRVGCVEGTLLHLWHGDLEDRRYRERWRELAQFGFDPFTDIAIDDSGCWRWNSDKPDMHRYVEDYFRGRREDGRDASRAG